VQVDPINYVLKAPGTMRFKVRMLSSFAFKSNLRHHIKVARIHIILNTLVEERGKPCME